MEYRKNGLTDSEKTLMTTVYNSGLSRKLVQETLAQQLGMSERSVRRYANQLGLGLNKNNTISESSKVLIYDLETSRIPAKLWWSGKQYVGAHQLKGEPKIITVAWKWLGDDEVFHLSWDKHQNDRDLVMDFSKIFNSADLVVGHNIINFDNRWLRARALKHGAEIDPYVHNFDTMSESKKLFRLPSYSLKEIAKFTEVTHKIEHEGIVMWDMIEDGTKEQQEEYMVKMIEYNIGDIVTNEEVFYKIRRFSKAHKVHLGALEGSEKYTCPVCGSADHVVLGRDYSTAAGTIQKVMYCTKDKVYFKISNRDYLKFLENEG